MPKAVDSDKTRRVTRRKSKTVVKSKLRSIKDLLTKAGLTENQITQRLEPQQYWGDLARTIVGIEWSPYLTRIEYERNELTVWVESAARAARVQLLLAAALVEGRLTLPATGQTPGKLHVRVSR